MKNAFALILLLSLSYAAVIWEFNSDGAINSKPVIYQGMVIFPSDDGKVYAINPVNGVKKWQTVVGKEPNEVFVFDNSIFTSTTNGKLLRINNAGNLQWTLDLNKTQNITRLYGASANDKYIFVTSDRGVFIIDKNGSVKSKIASFNESILTPPAAGPDYVVYGKGNELTRINENGVVQWKAHTEQSFWLSRPVISGGNAYIGNLDNQMHAYLVSNGLEIWTIKTKDWILSTPLVKDGNIYFGSNDGTVYAASTSGQIRWIAQTQLAVQTQPEAGIMGGTEVIFVGGNDKSIYALSKDSGEIVWKGSTSGVVGDPLFYQNSVIFGSQDGALHAYSTERACSITTPNEADVVGLKEIVVKGKYLSQTGGDAKVLVKVNSGEWEEGNATDGSWVYYIDPEKMLVPGINTISCKIVDSGGEESGPKFTTVDVNHDPTIALSQIVGTVSPNILEGEPFSVFVNDGDDGSPLDRVVVSFDGRGYKGDKNVSITIPQAGTYHLSIKKIGFKDATITVNVNSRGVNPIVLLIGVLLIVVILQQIWTRFLKQRFSKR